ncbi:unnamed protein product, partial [Tetraodon nigroviridis]
SNHENRKSRSSSGSMNIQLFHKASHAEQPADAAQPAAPEEGVHRRAAEGRRALLPLPPRRAGLLQPLLRGHVQRRAAGEPGRRGRLPRLAAPGGAGAAAGLRLLGPRDHQRGERRVAPGGRRHAAVPRHQGRGGGVPGEEPAPVQLPGHDAAVRRPPVPAAVRAGLEDVPGRLRRPGQDGGLPPPARGQGPGADPQRGAGGGGREPGVRGRDRLGQGRHGAQARRAAPAAALRAPGAAPRGLPAEDGGLRGAGHVPQAGPGDRGGRRALQDPHPAERRHRDGLLRAAPEGEPGPAPPGGADLHVRQGLRDRQQDQGDHPQDGHPQPPQGVQRLRHRLQARVPLQQRDLPVVQVRRRDGQADQLPRRGLGEPPVRGGRLLRRPEVQDAGLLRPGLGLLGQRDQRSLLAHSHRLRQHVEVPPSVAG